MGETILPASKPPKLLDRVRATMRLNRYSPRTEQVYVDWIKRFIRFHGVRHPQEMGADEVKAFLSHLATEMGSVLVWRVCADKKCEANFQAERDHRFHG
jgi:hypothetical protein